MRSLGLLVVFVSAAILGHSPRERWSEAPEVFPDQPLLLPTPAQPASGSIAITSVVQVSPGKYVASGTVSGNPVNNQNVFVGAPGYGFFTGVYRGTFARPDGTWSVEFECPYTGFVLDAWMTLYRGGNRVSTQAFVP